ncbi:MAG: hypothetical protein JRG86_01835 [Deltaproteobacteria bacterium]|nr:hypothetical protein [Deltaproteobacteria bacterium]MBW2497792.1 hypothetical protein [Deltaproteobacteria bacterium]
MANLLSRDVAEHAFPPLPPPERDRFWRRLRDVVRLERARREGARRSHDEPLVDAHERFEVALDELENDPSQAGLESLLEDLARLREREVRSSPDRENQSDEGMGPPGGDLICYWPGRSLGTGEAEIASLGFFDVLDRPPLGLWLGALARARPGRSGSFEVALMAWVPPAAVERARAGQGACTSGSLDWMEQASPDLEAQLHRLVHDAAGAALT